MVRGERTFLDAQMMEIVITEGGAHYTLGECKWVLEWGGCEKTKKRYGAAVRVFHVIFFVESSDTLFGTVRSCI